MPKVRLFFGLRDVKGRVEFEVNAQDLTTLFNILSELVPDAFAQGEPKPGILVFVDGVDYRLLGRKFKLRESSVIDVVPVNHPG